MHPPERYSTQHCMNLDCIKPWQFMCVTNPPEVREMCGYRGCDDHRLHGCEKPRWVLYIDLMGLLRAAT